MTSTQRLPVMLAINSIGITNNRHFFIRGQKSVFCQLQSSRTNYHANTDWLQLSHKSTGRFPTENQSRSQQSSWPSNSSRVQWLHPVWQFFLFYVVSYFCAGNRFEHGNSLERNKYKNQWDEEKHNSNSCNIKHLPFEMVYHYSQWLPSASIKGG